MQGIGHRGRHVMQTGDARNQPAHFRAADSFWAARWSTDSVSSGKVDKNRSGPLRSKPSSEVTWVQPLPISPNTQASGTNTSSSTTSLKWWPPFIEMMGRTSTPCACRSTMNWLSPACRCATSTGSVRASTMNACARCAPDVHTLVPVTDHPPSTRTARVRTLARSEPESGSLIPIPKKHSPRAIRGRNVDFCSSVPYFEERRNDLSVGNPVCGHGRSGSQQFFGDDEPFE